MKNIFRAPVDNQHFRDTIEEGKPVSEIERFLSGEDKIKLLKIAQNGIIRCWGSIPGESNSRNFKKLKEGDEFLCYRSGHYIALCTISFTVTNPHLARSLWSETETGKTWELIYFFERVRLFKIDGGIINSEFGFKEGPVMGFNAISEDKAEEFIREHGSVSEFIEALGFKDRLESQIEDEVRRLKINSPYEAQYYLVDLGNHLEYETYVPANDAGRTPFDKKLNELVTIRGKDLREYVAPAIFKPLSNIDVIWLKENYQPRFFFEVIHKTGWSEALLRLDLVTKHYESAKAMILGTKENKVEFENAIHKWSGPKDNFAYRDYGQLLSVHSETLSHQKLINEFLY